MVTPDREGAANDLADLLAQAIAKIDPTIGRRLDTDPQAHLDLIVLTSRAHAETRALNLSAVSSARSAGWSWEAIGTALGMSKQAAQQRFGIKAEVREDSPEQRRLIGLTATNEIEQLNEWGAQGWHSIAYGPGFHDVEKSALRWEHRRAVVGSRRARELDNKGWERIGTMWFPWIYFKRQVVGPLAPVETP